jgi:DNA replication protein DnaC
MRESSDIPPIKVIPFSSYELYMQQKCEWYNETTGNLPYIDCPKCKNRGYIAKLNENLEEVHVRCECMKTRENIHTMKKSGLGGLLARCTFESYNAETEWQQRAKALAADYVKNGGKKWLYVSGQSGCGKTHLCTAVCGQLMNNGKTVVYTVWRNLLHELQGLQFKEELYRAKLTELRATDVLYIDDFLKSLDNSKIGLELNFAFEIINARYNADKPTIISTEIFTEDLIKLDTATAGRIIEKTAGYKIQIKKENDRNYRLRGHNVR